MNKVTFEEFFREQQRLTLEHLALIFHAGWEAIPEKIGPSATAISFALSAMEKKAYELAKEWEQQ